MRARLITRAALHLLSRHRVSSASRDLQTSSSRHLSVLLSETPVLLRRHALLMGDLGRRLRRFRRCHPSLVQPLSWQEVMHLLAPELMPWPSQRVQVASRQEVQLQRKLSLNLQ